MNWYESDDPGVVGRGAAWRVGLLILAVVAVCALVSVGVWGFRVATSDIKGQGDAVAKKNSATNRIGAQERFESLYADIEATDRKLDSLHAAAAAPGSGNVERINFTGAQNACLTLVADYNAAARSYTSEDFRAIDLPAQIDDLSAATDCQPAK